MTTRRHLVSALCAVAAVAALVPAQAAAAKSQWSIFEEPTNLVTTGPATREATLNEIKSLGADTIRITLRWNHVAPGVDSRAKPAFDASDPGQYVNFSGYDDLVRRATAKGFRVLVMITGHAPLWAKPGRNPLRNYKPSVPEYRDFVTAVARRYSGNFGGLPRVRYFGVWHEPNQPGWLSPQSVCRRGKRCKTFAPHHYRRMVRAAYPAIKRANPGAMVMIGQLAPSGRTSSGQLKPIRPLRFLREFACRTRKFRRVRRGRCRRFKAAKGDAFGLHPYSTHARFLSPRSTSNSRDDAAIGDTTRFLRVLDRLTRKRGITVAERARRFPVYFAEFGLQTNPPDPFQTASPARHATFINESEYASYRRSRIKSYSQYLLVDEPPDPSAPLNKRWSSFQMGLLFPDGRRKASYEAYKYPIVVSKRRQGSRVTIWGRVRPGSGRRAAQLQRRTGGRLRNVSGRIRTDQRGHFVSRNRRRGTYRFLAFDTAGTRIGTSRTAKPSRR